MAVLATGGLAVLAVGGLLLEYGCRSQLVVSARSQSSSTPAAE